MAKNKGACFQTMAIPMLIFPAPSKRSRAARRATSPSIDTDKSLKDVQPPPRSAAQQRPSVLAVHQNAGVTKKSRNGRKTQMSAKARRRHEKGLQMAEAIAERTGKKVEKSKGRGRSVQERAKGWEEINKQAEIEEESDDEEQQPEADEKDDGLDEDMAAEEETAAPAVKPADEGYIAMDDDEEIL